MKTYLNLVATGVAGILSVGVWNSRADLEVGASFSIHAHADFYSPLAVHGAWIEVGTYGRCWRPAHVALEWRPYSYGHWVWTDCGWYWESDEPWAWACYHYGSWVYDPVHAWIWIPGIEWGPAWVEWRVGGGYIGWAPLAPPHVHISLGAPHFVFVQTARFHDRVRPSTVIVNQTTIINNTTVIKNIRHETRTIAGVGAKKVVINEGPGVGVIEKATGKKVKTASIRELAENTAVPAEVKAKGGAPKGKERTFAASADQQKSSTKQKSAPEQKRGPGEQRETPGKPGPLDLDKNKHRPAGSYVPSPGGAPSLVPPPGKPAQPNGRGGKGKGEDKEREPKEPKEGGKEKH